MVTVGMNYRVREGKDQVFEEGFRKVLGLMEQMDGHTASRLYRDTSDPREYLIVSEWESEDAFRRFIGSREFSATTDWGSAEILEGRPRHRIYRQ